MVKAVFCMEICPQSKYFLLINSYFFVLSILRFVLCV